MFTINLGPHARVDFITLSRLDELDRLGFGTSTLDMVNRVIQETKVTLGRGSEGIDRKNGSKASIRIVVMIGRHGALLSLSWKLSASWPTVRRGEGTGSFYSLSHEEELPPHMRDHEDQCGTMWLRVHCSLAENPVACHDSLLLPCR